MQYAQHSIRMALSLMRVCAKCTLRCTFSHIRAHTHAPAFEGPSRTTFRVREKRKCPGCGRSTHGAQHGVLDAVEWR